MLLRKYGPVLLGLGAVACGSSVVGRGPSAPGWGDLAESKTSPQGQPASAPGTKTSANGTTKSFDLREFQPVLESSPLASVRLKMEEERFSEAAAELAEWMAKERPTGVERARFSFLLGSMRRLAGDLVGAERALEPAAEILWLLRDDARLLLAEILQAEGRWQQALDLTERIAPELDAQRYLSLQAESLMNLTRQGEALPLLERLTEVQPESSNRLRLAACLLDLADVPLAGARKSDGRTTETASQAEARERLDVLATRALREARLAALGLAADSATARSAREMERRAKNLGAKEEAGEQELALLHATKLVEARLWKEGEMAASQLVLATPRRWDRFECEVELVRAKILAGQREWGSAAERLQGATERCTDNAELHAKILFNAGKFAAADSRNTAAAAYYETLERLYPKDSLADDSRLRRARAYLDAGVVSRFTELLLSLPEDYPDGDMTMEGVLDLALYRIERSDWAGASVVLERGSRAVGVRDSARGQEESGRERYFWARSLAETSREAEALVEYERIVRELPLSYYMLHAYSRLRRAVPERAARALSEGLSRAHTQPFSFPFRREYDSPQFLRGMELLRVGELDQGQRVLSQVGLGGGADDALLWGLALLYDRAGDAHVAHRIARGQLTDWLAHYPEGDWLRPWQIGFPRPYHEIVVRESQKTKVPEWFIYGVMREESTFDAQVVSHADAYGLMQLIIPTARAFAKKEGLPATPAALMRPSVNIALGSRVLASLTDRFKDNPWLAIPGYNAGPGRPSRWMRERSDVDFDVWVELIPFRETRRYTKRVLASRAAYAFVYYRDEAEQALRLPERLGEP